MNFTPVPSAQHTHVSSGASHRRLFSKIFVGVFSGLMTLCSLVAAPAVAQTELLTDEAAPTTVVVAFGGNATCQTNSEHGPVPSRIGLGQLMEATIAQLGKTIEPKNLRYALSCYSLIADYTSFTTDLGDQATVLKIPYETMVEDLANRINALPNPRLVVMGFSYGAWTAFKFLPLLGEHVRVNVLLTLDPLSKNECTVEKLLNAAADEKTHPGCVEAPSDLTSEELAVARSKADVWFNIYQTQGFFFHSGPMVGAKNILKNFPNTNPRTIWPHLLIARDPELRQELAETLASRVTSTGMSSVAPNTP